MHLNLVFFLQILYFSAECPVLDSKCHCNPAEACNFCMKHFKTFFPYKDQKRNLNVRKFIDELMETDILLNQEIKIELVQNHETS